METRRAGPACRASGRWATATAVAAPALASPVLAALLLAALLLAAFSRHPARGQGVADAEIYAGRTVTLIASVEPGGAVDLNARQVAKHMARFIPGGPTVVVRNMPGAGHLLAANFLFNQAPRDGLTFGTFINGLPLHQVTSGQGVRFDARRFNWIGSTGVSNLTIMVWHTAGIASIEDARRREVVLGATGIGSGSYIYAYGLNQLIGTRFKLVTGYKGINDIDLATERGEVQGRSGASLSGLLKEHPDWLRERKLFPIVQIGSRRDKLYPDVPLMHELGATEEQRRVLEVLSSPVLVGRPYMLPPETPPERVEVLRKAFWAAMNDAQFRAEAESYAMELDPIDGEQLARVVHSVITTPPDLLAKVKPLLAPDGGRR